MTKKLTFVILPLFLHNCSVLSYNDAAVLVKGYTLGYEEDTISKATYDESTASFANVKIGRGRSSTVVLAYVKDDLYEWRSADNVTLYTKQGMIFKITGLKSDVIFSSFDIQDDSLYGVEFESLVSFSDPILYRSIALNTIFKTDQQVIIRTPVGPMLTTKITHDFNVPNIGWKGRNYYYIDNNGVVVKSEQDIHPFLPRVTIQYFYKYD